MEKNQLENIFKNTYNFQNWKSLLKKIFVNTDFYQSPKEYLKEENENNKEEKYTIAKSIKEFATVSLADTKKMKFYDIELKPDKHVTKNRVGLRNLIHNEVIPGELDAILVVFHTEGDKDWRLTFISKSVFWDDDYNEQKQETNARRYTYVLGEDESVKTAVNQFEKLTNLENQQITVQHLIELFNVEKINKKFFDDYKKHYNKFWTYLIDTPKYKKLFSAENTEKQEKNIRDFTKKLLGRIVFLHFLQKKGWMGCTPNTTAWENGEKQFLLKLLEGFNPKEHFHSKCLTTLFFNTLNAKRKGELFEVNGLDNAINKTKVPYLNGGLFEKDKEVNAQKIDFPIAYFEELFDFFGQYNFTIDENNPDDYEVGIDPEMLGHIFENLLEDNKDKGAFYTPKEIVQYMTQESLIQYLQTNLGEHQEIENFIRNNDKGNENDKNNFIRKNAKKIEELLDKVKVCDPAIGSGAFPMGMLNEIFKAKMTLDWTLERAEVKKNIIQNSIYGVDLEHGAVDIARLRFWLALVVEEENPQALPNLDYKIMQGNSLLSKYSLNTHIDKVFKDFNKKLRDGKIENKEVINYIQNEEINLENFKKYINDYLNENEAVKKVLLRNLIEEIKKSFKDVLNLDEIKKLSEARGIIDNLKNSDIFGNQIGTKTQIKNAKNRLKNLEENKKDGILYNDSFEWRFEFPNLLNEKGDFEGFDIVIGNPPYIQLQKALPNNDNLKYADLYLKTKLETFERTGDIYSLFYEIGINLLKEKGNLCYITSNKWMRANYGKSLRKFFAKKNPILLLDLGAGIFETATVDTNILLIENAENKRKTKAITLKEKKNIQKLNKSDFVTLKNLNEESWIVLNPKEQKIKENIEKIGTPLKDWNININRGVLTGFNEAFIIDEKTKNDLIAKDPKSAEILKPILRGKDIKRYKANFANLWLIATFPALKINIDDYPAIKKYLENYLPKIKQTGEKFIDQNGKEQKTRKKTGNKWFETQDPISYYKEFEKEKIVFTKASKEQSFTINSDYSFLLQTAYIATGDNLKYLLSLLNSQFINYCFNEFFQSGGIKGEITYQAIIEIPIPKISKTNQKPFEILVGYILYLKHQEKTTKNRNEFEVISKTFEEVIDALVFELYFPEDFKKSGIEILKYATQEFVAIQGKSDQDQEAIILSTYESLCESENLLSNQIRLMYKELKLLLSPILSI